ncbi:MAG: 2-C-methyl-D-erythritol 4-phosphate cytidylyltransferase [Cyclobacteriaceae bacterium]
MKKYAVIVAGGAGTRMGSDLPKQFLQLRDKPILFHTLEVFLSYPEPIGIVLVLPEKEIPQFTSLQKEYSFKDDSLTVVKGGASRYESVSKGVLSIKDNDAYVAIHDGVRPFVTHQIIEQGFKEANLKGNAIPVVALKDSIRKVEGNENKAVDRSLFYLVQTPQFFQLSTIVSGYGKKNSNAFTDDASVAEYLGQKIHLFEGDYRNIKITSPEDLVIAEALLAQQSTS